MDQQPIHWGIEILRYYSFMFDYSIAVEIEFRI